MTSRDIFLHCVINKLHFPNGKALNCVGSEAWRHLQSSPDRIPHYWRKNPCVNSTVPISIHHVCPINFQSAILRNKSRSKLFSGNNILINSPNAPGSVLRVDKQRHRIMNHPYFACVTEKMLIITWHVAVPCWMPFLWGQMKEICCTTNSHKKLISWNKKRREQGEQKS